MPHTQAACACLLRVALLLQASRLLLQGRQLACHLLRPSLGTCSLCLSSSSCRLGLLLCGSGAGSGGLGSSPRGLCCALALLGSSLGLLGGFGLGADALVVGSSSFHGSLGGKEAIALLLGLQAAGCRQRGSMFYASPFARLGQVCA